MTGDGTQQEPEGSRRNIEEKIARRSIKLFQRRAELHQRHHVESDVDQPGMKKHRGDQTPPLMAEENEKRIRRAEAELRFADQSPKYG